MVFVLFNLFFSFEAHHIYKRVHGLWRPAKWPSMMSILSPHQKNSQSKISCQSLSFCCCFISAQYPVHVSGFALYKGTIYNAFLFDLLFLVNITFFEIYPPCWHSCNLFIFIAVEYIYGIYDCIMICFSIYHRYSFGFVVGSGIWTMFSYNIRWEFLYRTYLGLQLLNHRVQTHFCLKQCQTVLQSYY